MPLRSDFKIHAVPPGPPPNPAAASTFPEQADGGPAFTLRKLIQDDRRIREITEDIPRTPDTSEATNPPHRVAFLVTHGMGQQVPFETVSMIGQALITEHSKRNHEK